MDPPTKTAHVDLRKLAEKLANSLNRKTVKVHRIAMNVKHKGDGDKSFTTAHEDSVYFASSDRRTTQMLKYLDSNHRMESAVCEGEIVRVRKLIDARIGIHIRITNGRSSTKEATIGIMPCTEN
jgi:hypothetical protein